MKMETHDFYCIRCGNKGIPIARKGSQFRTSMHRKRLFCPWCKMEVNHVECRDIYDVEIFKEDFADGLYREEAEESVSAVRTERGWQDVLGWGSV